MHLPLIDLNCIKLMGKETKPLAVQAVRTTVNAVDDW
jgi:hypothetical protein